MNPKKQMEQAYGLWVFTCQIWHNIQNGKIDYQNLDNDFNVGLGNDLVRFNIKIPSQDVPKIASNNAMATTGICFSVFNTAMNTICTNNIKKKIDNPTGITAARVIVQQIRNAYSHDPILPRWIISNPIHQQVFVIEEIDLSIDLKALDGELFEIKHINNYQGLNKLFKYCMKSMEDIQT